MADGGGVRGDGGAAYLVKGVEIVAVCRTLIGGDWTCRVGATVLYVS